MKIAIPLLALFGFLWLAGQKPEEASYDRREVEMVNAIVLRANSLQGNALQGNISKIAAIQDLWNISDAEIAAPVNLFNNDGSKKE